MIKHIKDNLYKILSASKSGHRFTFGCLIHELAFYELKNICNYGQFF